MRSTKDEAQAEPAAEESYAEPKPQSVEDRLAALEAYMAFIRPKLGALIGAEPPPAPAEEQP